MNSRRWADSAEPPALKGLTYQRMSDSPTVKHYTDWGAYEPFLAHVSRCAEDGFSYELSGDARAGGTQIGTLLPPDESKIAAAHYAAVGGSRSLLVSGRASISLVPRDAGCGPVASRHSTITVAPGASLDLKVVVGARAGQLDLSFVELVLGAESIANVLIYLRPATDAPSASGLRAALGDGSKLNYLLMGSGSSMHHQDDRMLLGKSSRLRAGAFLASSNGTRIDRFLGIDHLGEDSSSSATSMGIALEGGYTVVRGIARITESAVRSRTEFTAGVALMGEGSRGYAVPMLEVHTGEVLEAKHHSFEAKPNADQLFYLRSRGLSESEAKSLIISGMATAQLDAVEGALSEEASSLLSDLMSRVGLEASLVPRI
ncbi:MAG: SufB/SufD family protein [Conexivisphaera sp.]